MNKNQFLQKNVKYGKSSYYRIDSDGNYKLKE